MKTKYPTKKLGEVLELCDSGTWGEGSPDGLPLLRSTNMQNGNLVLDDLKTIAVPEDKIGRYLLREGDILITKSSGSVDHIGKSLYITKEMDGKYGFSNFTQRLRVDKNQVLSKWVYLKISNPATRDFLLNASQTTTGLRNLKIPALKELEIPLPPLSEQKKIVTKLEKVLGKISEAKKLRAEAQKNTNNLLSVELHKIFEEGKKKGWEKKEIGKICKIFSGGSAPQGKQFFENGKYPFFRTSDVGAVHLSDNLCDVRDYLNDQGIKKLNLFKKGTILFPKSGVSTFLNHRVVMGCDGYVASHLATISAGEKINFRYLYYFLTLVDARDIAPNSSYPSLRIVDIGKIKIPLPSLAEQKKIVARLDKLSQKIEKIKKLQAATQNEFTILEQSILSKAFKGELK